MACNLAIQCDLLYGVLQGGLPEDTIDEDLNVCTPKVIHMFEKDYKSQSSQCSPWEVEVQPFSSFKKKMREFRRRKENTKIPSISKAQ